MGKIKISKAVHFYPVVSHDTLAFKKIAYSSEHFEC